MTVGQYVDAVVVPEHAVLESQEGTRVFVVDAENKVDVAKVTGIDTYRGLRVLEAGLEAGQRVIVEGVQLVRQGQIVKPEPAPLEKFMTEEAPPVPGDLRFNSRVSRMPGRGAPAQNSTPENPKNFEPEAGAPQTPIPTPPNSSKANPAQHATPPAGKQPR